jgi:hypothetical protein
MVDSHILSTVNTVSQSAHPGGVFVPTKVVEGSVHKHE